MQRRPSTQDISWLLDLYQSGQLDLNPPYQRRSAGLLRLFGVGGQLLFAHYALEVLSETLQLERTASICVAYLPALLALATVFYVVTRFQLVAYAFTPTPMDSTSASPRNSML